MERHTKRPSWCLNLETFCELSLSFLQGAAESILERSSYTQLADGSLVALDESSRDVILKKHSEMTSKGLRCLGLAYKDELESFRITHLKHTLHTRSF